MRGEKGGERLERRKGQEAAALRWKKRRAVAWWQKGEGAA